MTMFDNSDRYVFIKLNAIRVYLEPNCSTRLTGIPLDVYDFKTFPGLPAIVVLSHRSSFKCYTLQDISVRMEITNTFASTCKNKTQLKIIITQ